MIFTRWEEEIMEVLCRQYHFVELASLLRLILFYWRCWLILTAFFKHVLLNAGPVFRWAELTGLTWDNGTSLLLILLVVSTHTTVRTSTHTEDIRVIALWQARPIVITKVSILLFLFITDNVLIDFFLGLNLWMTLFLMETAYLFYISLIVVVVSFIALE